MSGEHVGCDDPENACGDAGCPAVDWAFAERVRPGPRALADARYTEEREDPMR